MGDKRIRIEKSNIDEGKWQKPTTVNFHFFRFRYAPQGNRVCATEGQPLYQVPGRRSGQGAQEALR